MMHSFDTTDKREKMLGATHLYDATVRAQVVHRDINPEYHAIISAVEKHSGVGVVLNTSYNLHGYPVVLGVRDALDVSINSDIQYVMLPGCLAIKRTSKS